MRQKFKVRPTKLYLCKSCTIEVVRCRKMTQLSVINAKGKEMCHLDLFNTP